MKPCPLCAEEIQDTAIRCRWCGADLTARGQAPGVPAEPPPSPTAPPEADGSAPLPSLWQRVSPASIATTLASPATVRRMWRGPVLAAAGAMVGIFVVALVVAAILNAVAQNNQTGGQTSGEVGVPRLALLVLFLGFRVPLTFGSPTDGTMTLQLSPLTVLLLFGVFIAIASRYAVAEESTGKGRLLALVRFAVLFSLLSLVASFFASISGSSRQSVLSANAFWVSPGAVSVHVSPAGAFFLTLFWSLLFGAVGAARGAYGRRWWRHLGDRLEKRLRGARAAMDGAVSGAGVALGLGLLAVLIAAIVAAARVPAGADTAPALLLLLVLPNLVAWAVLAGMGSTIVFAADFFDGSHASTSVGILGAAGDGTAGVNLAQHIVVPPYLFLLVLIPLIGMGRAGFVAARQSSDERLATRSALLAGIPLVLGTWILAWSAGGNTVEVNDSGTATFSAAVSLVAAVFLPLVWGVVGPWLGVIAYLSWKQRSGHARSVPADRSAGAPVATTAPAGRGEPHPTSPCPHCGQRNGPESNFCEACGTRLRTASEAP